MNNSISNGEIVIRAATIDDCKTVIDFNCCIAEETEEKPLARETVADGVESLLTSSDKGRYFVALVEGRIVGQIMHTWEFSDWRNGYLWWIQSVYVVPKARRCGVFRTMYRYIKSLAEADPQVVGLRLYVEQKNKPAQNTYLNIGMTDSHYIVMEEII